MLLLMGLASRFLLDTPLVFGLSTFPLVRMAMFTLCLNLAATVALNMATLLDRWLTPSFWIVPFCFFVLLEPDGLHPRLWRYSIWVIVIGAVFVLAVSLFSIRALWAIELLTPYARNVGVRLIKDHPKRNYPFDAIARESRHAGCKGGWIVTRDPYFAGNLRFQFPGNVVVVPAWIPGKLRSINEEDSLLVIWYAKEVQEIPADLRTWVKSEAGIDLRSHHVVYLELPYAYSLGLTAKVGFLCLPSIRDAHKRLSRVHDD